MKRIVTLVVVVLLVSATAFAESQSSKLEVRNPSGKLLYKTKTTGGTTEFRDASGKLLMKSKTTHRSTEVRSTSGKLLEKIKVK